MTLRKKVFMGLGALLAALLVLTAYAMVHGCTDFRQHSSKARTGVQLDALKAATTDYFKAYGQWPVTMNELAFNRSNIPFVSPPAPWKDGWGRPFSYTAPTNGTGNIASFGRDGLPGGAEFDADLKVSLP